MLRSKQRAKDARAIAAVAASVLLAEELPDSRLPVYGKKIASRNRK
jgi:hypothetical protein